jgi:hydrogenase maturation protease
VSGNPTTGSSGDFLVIGYGNTLRGDDGVGTGVAEAIERLNLAGVRTIACHQLTPELAEPISRAREVVFVDAAASANGEIQLADLQPAKSGRVMTHVADPGTLLAWARDLFGHCPRAWTLTIPARSTDFGEELSPSTRDDMESAVKRIRDLVAAERGGVSP